MDGKQGEMKTKHLWGREECALTPFFASPGVGVAVYDDQLRYQAVNHALAAMNGVAVEAHLGKRPHELLGQLGVEFERCLSEGFAQKEPVIVEFAGYLPTRDRKGHWLNTFIPIKNGTSRGASLFVLVLEVSEKKKLESALFGLTGKLLYVKENLRASLRDVAAKQTADGTETDAHLVKSLELVEESAADIAEALRLIRPGPSSLELASPAPVPKSLLKSLPATPAHARASACLSPREQEVLCLLASSESNKQIGARLGISVRTVESHRRRLMEKLGLHSVSELVHYAIRQGLVEA